ncbi:MAG TPA: hypothetical protein VHC69_09550 [Polyangiaceae bacterium]|nr:hypothetical protein [Polyangiaceae bacterium]
MHPSRRCGRVAIALTAATLACGCNSKAARTSPTASAEPPGFDSDAGTPSGGHFVSSVTGRFLDETGKPPDDGFGVSVCGPVCYLSETAQRGAFSVPIASAIDLAAFSVLPHGRPYVAGFYFALPEDANDAAIDVGDLRLVAMPHDGAPMDLDGAAPQVLESGPARLAIDAGTKTMLEFDDVSAGAAGSEFRAVSVDVSLMGNFVPADASMLVALGPFESYEVDANGHTVATQLSFANEAKLDAGAAVEFLALGTYLHPEWIAPARFAPVATGHVTSDGTRIELDAGSGFLYLTWVAIRANDSTGNG